MTLLTKRERIKLALAMQCMTPRSKLFKLLKAELTMLGYWKNKARGNPELGYARSRNDNSD